MPRAKPTAPESTVLRACLDLLRLRGVFAWRNNSGSLRDATGRPVRFGFVGSSDILALAPGGGGRLMAVECKRPGSAGKLTAPQRLFLEAVRAHGGVAIVVDDVAKLDRALTRLAVHPAVEFDIWGREVGCE